MNFCLFCSDCVCLFVRVCGLCNGRYQRYSGTISGESSQLSCTKRTLNENPPERRPSNCSECAANDINIELSFRTFGPFLIQLVIAVFARRFHIRQNDSVGIWHLDLLLLICTAAIFDCLRCFWGDLLGLRWMMMMMMVFDELLTCTLAHHFVVIV